MSSNTHMGSNGKSFVKKSEMKTHLLQRREAGDFRSLPLLDQLVLTKRFGLDGGEMLSLADVSSQLSCLNAERIRLVEQRALQTLSV